MMETGGGRAEVIRDTPSTGATKAFLQLISSADSRKLQSPPRRRLLPTKFRLELRRHELINQTPSLHRTSMPTSLSTPVPVPKQQIPTLCPQIILIHYLIPAIERLRERIVQILHLLLLAVRQDTPPHPKHRYKVRRAIEVARLGRRRGVVRVDVVVPRRVARALQDGVGVDTGRFENLGSAAEREALRTRGHRRSSVRCGTGSAGRTQM